MSPVRLYAFSSLYMHINQVEIPVLGGFCVIEEKKISKPKVQNLILENREKLSVSGVIDVESFNDECVIADTELGILIIKGIDLHINKLNIDNSELGIEGEIVSCEYSDRDGSRNRGGFFARMFK
jgi:sporulation protein YabP